MDIAGHGGAAANRSINFLPIDTLGIRGSSDRRGSADRNKKSGSTHVVSSLGFKPVAMSARVLRALQRHRLSASGWRS
jgi:hypothetical protein